MKAEPLQGVSEGRKDHFRSDSSEEAIQVCYDLLSSGNRLSDILVALKRLGPLDKHSQSDCGIEPSGTEIGEIAGEGRAASSQWRTVQVTQTVDQSREPLGALVRTGDDVSQGDASRSLVALTVPSSTRRVENGLRDKFSRPIGVVILWLIPAISLTIVGIAGKRLMDSDLSSRLTEATAVPILGPVEGIRDLPTPQAEAKETRAVIPAISGVSRTATEVAPNRPAAPNSPPETRSRRSTQPRHAPIERPFAMGWKIPSRLTDGF
jgi:hypothetical protein